MLEKDSSFGTSQFMETARYQRAMEGELSRSIMAMRSVKTARVHIASPKQSAFIRNRQKPTASVMVELYGGHTLGSGQVAAITHLVSSSIPHLPIENVSVVDQSGRLLTQQQGSGDLAASTAQLDYVRSLEQYYIKRIENLLTPIVGPGGVRAQVAADVDLTVTEQTSERYLPDGKIRSEQVVEESIGGKAGNNAPASGVPGALSNQPGSDAANAAAGTKPKGQALQETAGSESANASRRATRNFELDKVISHTKTTPGKILKLSVAVVVDHKRTMDEDDEPVVTPRTPEDIENFTALVRETVGFNAERGDSVQVVNTPFAQAPEIEELPEPGMLEQPIVWDIGRQGLAGMVVLFIIFFVLRPVLSGLASRPAPPQAMNYPTGAMALPPGAGGNMPMVVEGQAPMAAGGMEGGGSMDVAKSAVNQDAKRAAQVVKSWVASDGG